MFELKLTLPLLAAAALAWSSSDRLRSAAALAAAVGSGLLVVHYGGFSRYFGPFFALAFCLTLGIALLFGWRKMGRSETFFTLIYAAAAIAAVETINIKKLYFAWEVMAVASTLVILCGRTRMSRPAALRYVLVHLAGGLLLFAGILLVHYMGRLGENGFVDHVPASTGGVLILLGVLVNTAAWPIAAWLPDAYPETSPTGGVVLQAMTTKTAVYVLLTCFAGWDVLVWAGVGMALYGAIYGARENDIRRMLAYGIVNQTGFMVAGAGIGTSLALAGAATHAFACVIYTAVLWMAAGAVIRTTGKRHLADVGGLGRSMPLVAAMAWIGALSMAALPGTSGFAAKTFVLEAAAEDHMAIPWLLLEIAAASVVLHGGLRFVWQTFHGPKRGPDPSRLPAPAIGAMIAGGAVCIGIGVAPGVVYGLLPSSASPDPELIFTAGRMASQVELLAFAALGFFILLPWLPLDRKRALDTDWIYVRIGRFMRGVSNAVFNPLNEKADKWLRGLAAWLAKGSGRAPGAVAELILLPCRRIKTRDPEERRRLARLAREAVETGTTPAGVNIFLTLLALLLLLALFFRPT